MEEELKGLKQFQVDTVKSVIDKFYNDNPKQTRVLIADEVGLGKTMIARGTLEQVYKKENKNEMFKVVYICSNQNIARQNIEKILGENVVFEDGNVCDRLSMLSFKIFEDSKKINTIYPVILTPETSFRMQRTRGKKDERALICGTLCKIPELTEYKDVLIDMLAGSVNYFEESVDYVINRIEEYQNEYIETVKDEILKNNLIHDIEEYKDDQEEKSRKTKRKEFIKKVRFIFAQLGIKALEPDLVIMDEFQRFPYLLSPSESDLKEREKGLVEDFFNSKNEKVILLSATPYKFYATKEEVDKASNNRDEFYREFLRLMKFLYKDEDAYNKFKKEWDEYSQRLKKVDEENFDSIKSQKEKAEKEMRKVMLRTERITDSKKRSNDAKILNIKKNDIKSYIQIRKMIDNIKEPQKNEVKSLLREDYVKSCPYILSYMNSYKLKQKLKENYPLHKMNKKEQNLLWINPEDINYYKYNNRNSITDTNAELNEVSNIVFKDNIEKLLWIPPTKTYYNLKPPFDKAQNATKTLIFSKWSMVPKMVSTILSYESERKTIFEAGKKTNNEDKIQYFAGSNKGYPYLSNMEFKKDSKTQEEGRMNLLTLIYPSEKLASLYNPIETLNEGFSAYKIRSKIKNDLVSLVKKIEKDEEKVQSSEGEKSNRWYYLFPLLIDSEEHVQKWIRAIFERLPENWFYKVKQKNSVEEIEKWMNRYIKAQEQRELHIKRLAIEYVKYKKGFLKLGKRSENVEQFYEILTNMVMGSPAICVYRNLPEADLKVVFNITQSIIKIFKEKEALAILDLCYSKGAYWKKILKYCYAGNLQAVIDEYFYMIVESNFLKEGNKNEQIEKILNKVTSLGTRTTTIDTYENFINKNKKKQKKMRTRFAVEFSKETEEEKNIKSKEQDQDLKGDFKEKIRLAFNSPFKPFVLTTTSVGQEGLDFHYYCKRIIHWNLPDNPIDIEQREGRINRYKCLGIRRYIAKNNKVEKFENNIWNEMFESIEADDNKRGLIPYWCIPDDKDIEIERIVPVYPFSREKEKFQEYLDVLDLYRITLGQENQQKLLDNLSSTIKDKKKLKELLINLRPFTKDGI